MLGTLRIKNNTEGTICQFGRIMTIEKAIRTAKYFQSHYDEWNKAETSVYFRAIGSDEFKRVIF